MDPLSVVTTLISVTRYLIAVAEKVQQNKQECQRLAKHADEVGRLILNECKDGVPRDLETRLVKLTMTLGGLTGMLDELNTKPLLMKVLWRSDVSDRIAEAYKALSEAMQLCKMGMAIDMRRVMQENEEARRMDTEAILEKQDQGLANDHEIISRLEVHRAQMQEAMTSIYKKLQQLEHGSAERPFLEQGMHAIQRRSGAMQLAPDEFVITSLDVIIHKDEKLGEGGFSQVFRGDWQGVVVAVKMFEKGIPQPILQKELDVWKRLRHPHILQFHGACSIADPPFAVCAYKANGDALVYLARNPDVDRLKLLFDASLGLRYLHGNSVVHGDLKASNILIDEHGDACLADFGLSTIKNFTTTVRKHATETQVGTARWMAPEQLKFGVINTATDVYSFGMTMYEVFTGIPPFANTPDGLLIGIVADRKLRPPRPDGQETRTQGLSDKMWALIDSCWSAESKNRPAALIIVSTIETCRRAPKPSAPNAARNRVVSTSLATIRSLTSDIRRKGRADQEPAVQTQPDRTKVLSLRGASSSVGGAGPVANDGHPTAQAHASRDSLDLPVAPRPVGGGSQGESDSDSGSMEGSSSNDGFNLNDDAPVAGFAVAKSRRNRSFHELFPDVPEDDYLIEDYGCALARDILVQGRLYISEGYLCFHANIFGWVTRVVIPFYDVVSLEKKKMALVVPNAILVKTQDQKYTFASFMSRDKAHDLIQNIWRLSRTEFAHLSTDDDRQQGVGEPRGASGATDAPTAAGGAAVAVIKAEITANIPAVAKGATAVAVVAGGAGAGGADMTARKVSGLTLFLLLLSPFIFSPFVRYLYARA